MGIKRKRSCENSSYHTFHIAVDGFHLSIVISMINDWHVSRKIWFIEFSVVDSKVEINWC
jgi:hypothetical protein